MSTNVRYEIEVKLDMGDDAASTVDGLRTALADHPDAGFGPASEMAFADGVTFYGEESDWSRDHSDRHDAVCAAIRTTYPAARIATRWLNVDFMEWDDSFDDEDETEEVAVAS